MNKQKAFALLIAVLGVSCYVVIGIALSMRNVYLGIGALLASFIIIGYGFSQRKKWREN